MGNTGCIEGDLFDLRGHLDSALQRGGVGQLDVHQQVAPVLDGDEPAGDAGEADARQTDQGGVDKEHDDAEAEAPASRAVGLCRPFEGPVEAAEETAQGPVHRVNQEPAQHPSHERARKEKEAGDSPRQQGGSQAVGSFSGR